jgi:hypothetical protein
MLSCSSVISLELAGAPPPAAPLLRDRGGVQRRVGHRSSAPAVQWVAAALGSTFIFLSLFLSSPCSSLRHFGQPLTKPAIQPPLQHRQPPPVTMRWLAVALCSTGRRIPFSPRRPRPHHHMSAAAAAARPSRPTPVSAVQPSCPRLWPHQRPHGRAPPAPGAGLLHSDPFPHLTSQSPPAVAHSHPPRLRPASAAPQLRQYLTLLPSPDQHVAGLILRRWMHSSPAAAPAPSAGSAPPAERIDGAASPAAVASRPRARHGSGASSTNGGRRAPASAQRPLCPAELGRAPSRGAPPRRRPEQATLAGPGILPAPEAGHAAWPPGPMQRERKDIEMRGGTRPTWKGALHQASA